MQWYNSKTNELSTIPPWGNGWICFEEIKNRYPDWQQVNDDFIPLINEKSEEELLIQIRQKRDQLFQETQWVFMRQITGTTDQKLLDNQYQKWIDYWSELRNFPNNCDINNPIWPIQPSF